MKNIILLLLIIVPTLCFADPGPCYCVQADIENLNGEIQTAYFKITGGGIYIENRNGEYGYYTKQGWIKLPLLSNSEFDFELEYQAELSAHVLSTIWDTLKYSSDFIKIRYRIENENQLVGLLGENLSIAKSQIKNLKVNKLMRCGVGTSILTDLELFDKKWAEKVAKTEPLGGYSMCDITAIHFNASMKGTALINNLKIAIKEYSDSIDNYDEYSNEDRVTLWKKVMVKVNLLKEKKIIVLMTCIC